MNDLGESYTGTIYNKQLAISIGNTQQEILLCYREAKFVIQDMARWSR